METSKNDITSIIEGIKRFMPDFSVMKDDLVNIKSTFVISFYRRYLIELARNCKTVFNNDGDSENVLDICSGDTCNELFVFLRTRDILSRIGVSYFTICDFYRPSNRTRLTIKVCLNFLLYIKENLPKAQAVVQNFNDEVIENQMRIGRILEKKKVIGEFSSELGLYQETLNKLQREYDAETNLQVTLLDTQVELVSEIKDCEKEVDAIERHIFSEEQRKNILDGRIDELKKKIVSENYESQEEILEELKVKIQEHQKAILQSEEALDERHEQLTSITEFSAVLKNCDVSVLDHVKELDRLKQRTKELESARDKIQSTFEEMQADFDRKNRDFANTIKRQEVYLEDLKTASSTMKSGYDKWIGQLYHERELHKDLEKKASILKEELEARYKACSRLEEEHVLIQTKIQEMYQLMLSSQNLITNSFNELL